MSGGPGGPVELSAGSRLVLAGTEWQVERFEPHVGRVLLRRSDGRELATTVRALVNHSDCRPAPPTPPSPPPGPGPPPPRAGGPPPPPPGRGGRRRPPARPDRT